MSTKNFAEFVNICSYHNSPLTKVKLLSFINSYVTLSENLSDFLKMKFIKIYSKVFFTNKFISSNNSQASI
jgi:hypothetical protein